MTEAEADNAFLLVRENLLSYLYRLAGNRDDAEDLLQDAYIRVKEKYSGFRGDSGFKTWVFAIATNLARDNRRVKNRWPADAQDACRDAAVAHEHLRNRMQSAFQSQTEKRFELEEHINYCFTCIAKNLPLEKQLAVILKEVYDFKRTEIAAILGVSEGVVKHLLFEGRRDLQEKFAQRCALIGKTGACYQCAQLNDYFQEEKNAADKLARLGFSPAKSPDENLDLRFRLISRIHPLRSPGAKLEDTILQILREAIGDS